MSRKNAVPKKIPAGASATTTAALESGEQINLLNKTTAVVIIPFANMVQMLPPGVAVPVPISALEHPLVSRLCDEGKLVSGDAALEQADPEATRILAEVKNHSVLQPKPTSMLSAAA